MNLLKKSLNYLIHPSYILFILAQRNIVSISDEKFVKILYKKVFGKRLDLDNPTTFNEKLQWLKLYDRNPKYTMLVDKYEVKKYISDVIGAQYLIKTLGVYDSFDEIDFNELPDKFVIKCTHDSGSVVICKDKKTLDIEKSRKKINKALKKNWFYIGREWAYKDVKPRIIIEEYMEDENTKELIDYKVMCFGGEPKVSFTCSERFNDGLKVTFFDLDWQKLPFERHYPSSDKKIEKPQNYQKMLEFSKKLSKDIPFVRVDWYEINGKLYFSELTLYPGDGCEEFNPEKWDNILGSWLVLDKKKVGKK